MIPVPESPVPVALVAVARRTEFAADAAAARETAPAAVATLLRARDARDRPKHRLGSLLASHPPDTERIERVRAATN